MLAFAAAIDPAEGSGLTVLPGTTWRMLAQRTPGAKLPKGLDAAWDAGLGVAQRLFKRRQRFLRLADQVVAQERPMAQIGDAALRELAGELRDLFRRGRETPSDLLRAFALVREAAFRQIGERPFAVQVAGALALEAGCVAEMATGEGKTLSATMPAVIAGWRGRGCHIITVNDYLARRDAGWMRKIYEFCGVSVAHVEGALDPPARRLAYQADVTYCTNKEVTADFLRDRLTLGRLSGLSSALLERIAEGAGSGTDRLVQRGLNCAIVDEADSVLIDEAVTPLIISGEAPNPQQVDTYQQAVDLAAQLAEENDYRVNHRHREIELTDQGRRRLAEIAGPIGGLWHGARRREELVVQALTAEHFYGRDRQYVVADDKVVIVDEFTGRLMPDRTWRDGLHQAIEAKERLMVNPPKDTCARISFQRFFRMYRKISGMTGTAAEAWREFWQIYHMPVVVIPPNRPCIRQVLPNRVYAGEPVKWTHVVEEIRRQHQLGRPVLIGTRSVRASEHLSGLLAAEGLPHQVLNAVRHAEEAQIVAGAGQPGCVTVATNMAGRGTDIKLGRGVADLGGLHVIATERHEAGRIDRQLYGRGARQGDPGSAVAMLSLQDELVRRYAPHLSAALLRRYGQSQSEITFPLARRLFHAAQRKAQRLALSQRKAVLRTDDWLDEYLGLAGSER